MKQRTPIEPTWLHKRLNKNPGEIPERIMTHQICRDDYCNWVTRVIGLSCMGIVCVIMLGVVLLSGHDVQDISGIVLIAAAFSIWIGYLIVATYVYRKLFSSARTVERKMRAKIRRGELELIPPK